MPRNNKNLITKNIDGKKIREQYFDGLLFGVFIAAAGYTIFYLFDIKNFSDNFLNVIIAITCFSPFILLSILNKFAFGKILCVLSEDKLYYFNAETRINKRHNNTNGYINYEEIEKIEYLPPTLGKKHPVSRLIISGANFEITIRNAKRSLVKKINKRR